MCGYVYLGYPLISVRFHCRKTQFRTMENGNFVFESWGRGVSLVAPINKMYTYINLFLFLPNLQNAYYFVKRKSLIAGASFYENICFLIFNHIMLSFRLMRQKDHNSWSWKYLKDVSSFLKKQGWRSKSLSPTAIEELQSGYVKPLPIQPITMTYGMWQGLFGRSC